MDGNVPGIYGREGITLTNDEVFTFSLWFGPASKPTWRTVQVGNPIGVFWDEDYFIVSGGTAVLAYGSETRQETGVWDRVAWHIIPPAGARYWKPRARVYADPESSVEPGDFAYVADAMLTEGTELHDWFSGSTPPNDNFSNAWTIGVGRSVSHRLPNLRNNPWT